jgi:hypothetical protein
MPVLEKYGWKYYADNAGDNFKLQVIPPLDSKRKLPTTLFKYHSVNPNSIDALEKEYLYAPHPGQLNDPFDCDCDLINFDDEMAIETFMGKELAKKLRDESSPEDFVRNVQYNFSQICYSFHGILSLTDDPINLLMWAYYSNNNGFVIEYDYSKFKFHFHGPFQVNYQERIEAISIKSWGPICMLYQMNVKAQKWRHESEWRLLIYSEQRMLMPGIGEFDDLNDIDRKFSSKNCILSIILGESFFNKQTEFQLQSNGEMHIVLPEGANDRNRILAFAIENRIEINLTFKENRRFSFYKKLVDLQRLDRNRFLLSNYRIA